jgi:hypothetical protein
MAARENISFGQFGDMRDEHPDTHMYQPKGSKNRFEIQVSSKGSSVMARRLGKPDSILPGGRAAKQLAGGLHTWKEDPPEVLTTEVRKGFQGQGLAQAMLHLAQQKQPNLSHSHALSAEGARFAHRNPLPGDTQETKRSQAGHLVADAATAMLGGPRRSGYL